MIVQIFFYKRLHFYKQLQFVCAAKRYIWDFLRHSVCLCLRRWLQYSIRKQLSSVSHTSTYLYNIDRRSVSRADQDAVVFRERHQILRQNDNNDACRITSLRHVLVLLYVHRHRQTYSTPLIMHQSQHRLYCVIMNSKGTCAVPTP